MIQKRRKADSGKAIGETTALRWEPTHVTKPNPRVVPLHPRVFAVELRCEFRSRDFRGRLPGIVFTVISLSLDKVLESSLVPTTVEYLFYFPLRFSIDDYRR